MPSPFGTVGVVVESNGPIERRKYTTINLFRLTGLSKELELIRGCATKNSG